tara:strand:+ start:59 stop:274 length:216 start_codon:yes stop_codon:yes gene_type:complete
MRFWFRRKKDEPKRDKDIEAVVEKFEEEVTLPPKKQSRLLSLHLFRQKSNAQFVKDTNAKSANGKEKSKSK